MAWSASQLLEIEAAIASGALTVNFAGPPARTVTYRSMDDLLKAYAVVKAAIEDGAGTRQSMTSYAQTKQGL